MSWEAGLVGVLAVALLGGFLWYERSRPPAQVVALVAALAALAAAGRVALSPIPNVVPTTDITLIAGYALGGPPGFAVGALAALVSNFWLGQGPWTPWQMAGWGMTGLLGAGLAAASGRCLNRYTLAAFCGLAGLAYGALLDFSLMVTYGGEQSLDRFLALSARGLPFNIAHAAGNVVFALVAGPALGRMLLRYRSRFEFAWPGGAAPERPGSGSGSGRRPGRGAVAGAACALLVLALALSLWGAASRTDAAGGGAVKAADWLRSAQDEDGGFGTDPGGDPNPGMTGWAALGLEAAGSHPADVRNGGSSALDYLRDTVSEITTTGDIERTILVLAAAGRDPSSFEGKDLVARLLARRGSDGSFGRQVNPTAFGVLALDAAGERSGLARSAAWLRGAANEDGGWGFAASASSDADSTGAVLQALADAGGSGRAIRAGVRYLRGAQRSGGGFALSGGQVNAQSTAWAIQGLIAAGVSPSSMKVGGRTPFDYLASLQASDGHYRYSASSDQTPVWVTAQALQAVQRAPFPLSKVRSTSAGGGSASSGGGGGESVSGGGDAPVSSAGGDGSGDAAGGVAGASGAGDAAEPGETATTPTAAPSEVARFQGDDDSPTGPILFAAAALLVGAGAAYFLSRRGPAG